MNNITLHTTVDEIDSEKWMKLACDSVCTSFFQTIECYRFYNTLSFMTPFVIGVSEDDNLTGLICGYIIADGNPIKRYFSRRAIIPGGALLSQTISNEALFRLLESMKKELIGKCIYIEFRNYTDYSVHKSVFEQSSFKYQPHLNFHISTPDADTALKNLSSTKRRDIKLSKKQGAEWIETVEHKDIIEFYELLKDLYLTKIKLPLFPISFFEKLILTGIGKLFIVKYDGRIIGGSVCILSSPKAVFEWFVCGLDGQIKNIFPSTLATWAGIEYAALNGYQRFDMMGAGKPDEGYGVREFKSKFGGELVEHGRYIFVCKSLLFFIGKKIISLIKKR
jgi:hypothetical protein